MRTLAESPNYILWNDYETVYLRRKLSSEDIELGYHYGDTCCGLISPEEKWFLAGGEGLSYFDFTRGSVELMRDSKLIFDINVGNKIKANVDQPYFAVHSMRLEDKNTVRILIDPWSHLASTWLLNIPDLQLTKLRDGPSLVEQPYQEAIEF
jgi:hypothetical protein